MNQENPFRSAESELVGASERVAQLNAEADAKVRELWKLLLAHDLDLAQHGARCELVNCGLREAIRLSVRGTELGDNLIEWDGREYVAAGRWVEHRLREGYWKDGVHQRPDGEQTRTSIGVTAAEALRAVAGSAVRHSLPSKSSEMSRKTRTVDQLPWMKALTDRRDADQGWVKVAAVVLVSIGVVVFVMARF